MISSRNGSAIVVQVQVPPQMAVDPLQSAIGHFVGEPATVISVPARR
jgi:hypothetical protein